MTVATGTASGEVKPRGDGLRVQPSAKLENAGDGIGGDGGGVE